MGDNVQFVFESEKEDRISDFSLKLLDIEAENLGIPENQQYKGVIKMPSGELQKICRDLKEFGDSITMHCTKDGLKFTGKGVVKPREAEKDGEKVQIHCTEPVTAAFALRYLNFFTKATPLSETVTIQLSDETPLIVEYELDDKTESGSLRFYLAPKIDE